MTPVHFIYFFVFLSVTLAASAAQLPLSWQRGTVVFALKPGAFNNSISGIFSDLRGAVTAAPGIDTLGIQFMWHVRNASGNEVFAVDVTPTNSELTSLTRFARRSLGLRVLWKPLVVAKTGEGMSEISPSNSSEWFASYLVLLEDLAELASAEGVEMFSVGLELQQLSTSTSPGVAMWADLVIPTIRAKCPACKLTYCSNPLTNETQRIPFWAALDFIGVDWYPPLIVSRDPSAAVIPPSMAAMITTYDELLHTKLLKWYINASAAAADGGRKPLGKMFITESGYPSSNAGLQSPWGIPRACDGLNAPNASAQASAFAAAFAVLSSPAYSHFFSGFLQFWWGEWGTHDWYPERALPNNVWGCGWTPVGKNGTLHVLRAAFARSGEAVGSP